MPNPLLPALMLLALAPAPAAAGNLDGMVLAQLIIRQRIVIRVQQPMGHTPAPPVPPQMRMDEKKGPKCVPLETLAGSAVTRKDSVDMLMSDGGQMRAKLEDDCPSLDFYAGFYLKRTPDGMLCANRDAIRARSGRACAISAFKKLRPHH